jgi:hypothetical protein
MKGKTNMMGNCHEIRGQVTVTLGTVAPSSTLDVDVPLANTKVGDRLLVNPNAALPAGLIASAPRVKSDGVVTVTVANVTAAPIVVVGDTLFDVSIIKKTGSV